MHKKLDIKPETLAFMERRGVDGIRAAVMAPAYLNEAGLPFRPEQAVIMAMTPDSGLSRAEAETWLRWKAEQDGRLIRIGVWASVIAAIASIIAVVIGVAAWLLPVGSPPGH